MKKSFFLGVIIILTICASCTRKGSKENEVIINFLTELYQVESFNEYNDYLVDLKNEVANDGSYGIQEVNIENPFVEKYENLCSEKGLDILIQNGYLTKYKQEALSENCFIIVKGIDVRKDEVSQYHYTIRVEKKLDNEIIKQKGEGIIKLDEKNCIDWIKVVAELKSY